MPEDLLANIDSGNQSGEVIDLLSGLGEGADANAWVPTEAGQGIQGTVVAVGSTTSEHTTEPVPVITLETPTGEKHRIIAYATVLRREIEENNPQRGDLFAIKYLGKLSTKDGKREFHAYKTAIRRGTGAAVAATKAPF